MGAASHPPRLSSLLQDYPVGHIKSASLIFSPKRLGFALSILLSPASLLQEQQSQDIAALGGEGPSVPVPSSHWDSEPRPWQMSLRWKPRCCLSMQLMLQAAEIYCSREKILFADSPPPQHASRCRASLHLGGERLARVQISYPNVIQLFLLPLQRAK